MTDEEKFQRAMRMVEDEVCANPLGLWYLSYADDDGFRGGVYIEANGPTSAVMTASMAKLSPGGEVLIVGPVPEDKIPDHKFWNRLLTKAELQQSDPDEWKTLGEFEAEKESE
jgi:hypothetical protein